jgi:hypothetical protein
MVEFPPTETEISLVLQENHILRRLASSRKQNLQRLVIPPEFSIGPREAVQHVRPFRAFPKHVGIFPRGLSIHTKITQRLGEAKAEIRLFRNQQHRSRN